jgi:type II secretory pathway pseudopilin PulG
MAFENIETEPEAPETPPPQVSNKPTIIIVAAILGGITLLALACIAVYALVLMPIRRNSQATQVAQINAQNTQVALAITQTAAALAIPPTATRTPVPPNTPTPSPTPIVAVPTNTPLPTEDPRTATVAALLTQAAITTRTVIVTSTALPSTGFADQVGGLPGLMAVAALLIIVIFLARRLRTAS